MPENQQGESKVGEYDYADDPEAEEEFEINEANRPMVEKIAEAMAIHAGVPDPDKFLKPAQELLNKFIEIEGHEPDGYDEFEAWVIYTRVGNPINQQ